MSVRFLEQTPAFLRHRTDSDLEFPDVVQLEITRRCNLRCGFCPLTNATPTQRGAGRDLTPADLDRLAPLFDRAGAVELTGFGEIFCHVDLIGLLRAFRARNLAVYATTNGLLADPSRCESIVAEGLIDGLTFSIDAADAATYRALRGGDWSKLIANIEALGEAKKRLGRRAPQVDFSFLAMRRNVDALAEFVDLAARFGATRVIVQHLTENERFADQNCRHDPNQLDAALDAARRTARNKGVALVARNPESHRDAGPGWIKDCPLPWNQTFVRADGTLSACAMVWDVLDIGNLKEDSFERLWQGERYTALRKAMASDKAPRVCRNCRYFGWREPLPLDELASSIEMSPEDDRQLTSGWHPPDLDPTGRYGRWTRQRATAFLASGGKRMLQIEALTHPDAPWLEGCAQVTPWTFEGAKPAGESIRIPFSTQDLWGEPLALPLPQSAGQLLRVDLELDRSWCAENAQATGRRRLGILVYRIGLDLPDAAIGPVVLPDDPNGQLGRGWLPPESVGEERFRWIGRQATALIRSDRRLAVRVLVPKGLGNRRLAVFLDDEALGQQGVRDDGKPHELVFALRRPAGQPAVVRLVCAQAAPAPNDRSSHARVFGALIGALRSIGASADQGAIESSPP